MCRYHFKVKGLNIPLTIFSKGLNHLENKKTLLDKKTVIRAVKMILVAGKLTI